MYDSIRWDAEVLAVVDGRFDGAVAPAVYADLAAALADGVGRILIDLCSAVEVDDGAIAVLAALSVDAAACGAELYVQLEPGRLCQLDDASLVRAIFDD
jgi:anti-anti-sigma regulatory factor